MKVYGRLKNIGVNSGSCKVIDNPAVDFYTPPHDSMSVDLSFKGVLECQAGSSDNSCFLFQPAACP